MCLNFVNINLSSPQENSGVNDYIAIMTIQFESRLFDSTF